MKVFPDLPYFEMMTCSSDLPKFLKLIGQTTKTPYWSPKKDGVRTWAIRRSDNSVEYLSRSGLSYLNFSAFDREIRKLTTLLQEMAEIPLDTPVDGESVVVGGDFQEVMRNIRTLEESDSVEFEFNVFDLALRGEPFSRRYDLLKKAFSLSTFQHLKLLEHLPVDHPSEEVFLNLMEAAVQAGDEGIVLKDGGSPYEFKEKSKYWLKLKPIETYDLLVVGTYPGKKGKKYDGTLGGLVVRFEDTEVRVGGGYSDSEREEFLRNPPRMIEVACKGRTEDGSLREPRFIRVRDDKLTSSDELGEENT